MNANQPTIARLKAEGIEGVDVTSRDCRRTTFLPFVILSPGPTK
jgi:hypothetical protein